MKKLGLLAIIVAFVISSCFVEFDPTAGGKAPRYGTTNGPQRVEGKGKGFNASVNIVVTLSVVDGMIVDAQITHSDTPSHANPIINPAQGPNGLIVQNNSFDYLDNVSGATATRRGLQAAGNDAIGKIQ